MLLFPIIGVLVEVGVAVAVAVADGVVAVVNFVVVVVIIIFFSCSMAILFSYLMTFVHYNCLWDVHDWAWKPAPPNMHETRFHFLIANHPFIYTYLLLLVLRLLPHLQQEH